MPILADFFGIFSKVSLTRGKFELAPAHYLSAPQMSGAAILKKTEVRLDLIADRPLYLIIESGMRGAVYLISKPYAKANNQ